MFFIIIGILVAIVLVYIGIQLLPAISFIWTLLTLPAWIYLVVIALIIIVVRYFEKIKKMIIG